MVKGLYVIHLPAYLTYRNSNISSLFCYQKHFMYCKKWTWSFVWGLRSQKRTLLYDNLFKTIIKYSYHTYVCTCEHIKCIVSIIRDVVSLVNGDSTDYARAVKIDFVVKLELKITEVAWQFNVTFDKKRKKKWHLCSSLTLFTILLLSEQSM